MKRHLTAILLLCGLGCAGSYAGAQTGTIEFDVRIRPASGLSEPARGIPFVLLSRSYEDIESEVDKSEPSVSLDAFVDKLTLSPELKDWMKKNHTVSLSGEDLVHLLKADDVVKVPEFLRAYLELHSEEESFGFPNPKYRAKDEQKDPEKYKRLRAEYLDAIRKYYTDNSGSADGIDLHLTQIDPGPEWLQLQAKRKPNIHNRTLEEAQSQYVIGRCETDLNGQASLQDVPPGEYWLSTLDVEAEIGDAHLRWDTPITVRPGQVTRMELSNVNALQPHKSVP